MVMNNFKIEWTEKSIQSLDNIYKFHSANSELSAKTIIAEIVAAPYTVVFPNQYQKDFINPKYRRIIGRDYKIYYVFKYNVITIINIISSKRNPDFF
jgi:plasmid stabilization system protein ParE